MIHNFTTLNNIKILPSKYVHLFSIYMVVIYLISSYYRDGYSIQDDTGEIMSKILVLIIARRIVLMAIYIQ